ncbi:hypothetical protein L7F22_056521 [Adiantum nelumboides]|nr:hypothetical protein [Adiantum nelumboides]
MAEIADIDGYWGPITSRTTCEDHYAVSAHIAEFFNTISSVPGILLAFLILVNSLRQGFEKRFSSLNFATMMVGLGSMLFHGTLQHVKTALSCCMF